MEESISELSRLFEHSTWEKNLKKAHTKMLEIGSLDGILSLEAKKTI